MSYLKKYLSEVVEKNQSSAAISFYAAMDHIQKTSPEVAKSILKELEDQRSHLKLIASENFSSLAVQLAMGNLLTDKYSEGYPYHRFYAGCENVDVIEQLAVDKAKELFQAEHAYVQPHSGADANMVAYWAILVYKIQNRMLEKMGKKSVDELSEEEYEVMRKEIVGQKVMGMSLGAGGHLTHGYRQNISAKMMRAVSYGVDPVSGLLDYAVIEKIAKKEKPLILVAGYSAYPRLINFAKMREIADSVGAVLMVDMAHFAGLVAGKVFTGEYNPVPYAHVVTSTTHKTLRGPRGGIILCKKEFQEVIDKGCPLVLGGPLPHVMAAKAVAFTEALLPSFSTYSHQIVKNAKALAEELKKRGCEVLTGGTDNHLLLIDVNKSFHLTGRQAEMLLRSAKMTVNRNAIPGDVNGPWYTSAIRMGTPALTTLGMKEKEMKLVAGWVVDILKNSKAVFSEKEGELSRAKAKTDAKVLAKVHTEIKELLEQFPLYPELALA
jgi:glycine hydroxymethyltransferase